MANGCTYMIDCPWLMSCLGILGVMILATKESILVSICGLLNTLHMWIRDSIREFI